MNLQAKQEEITIEYTVDQNSIIDIDASKIIDNFIEDDETSVGSIAAEVPQESSNDWFMSALGAAFFFFLGDS